jgi:hypothetical protein
MNDEQKDKVIELLTESAGELSQELALMHGTLMNLVLALRRTGLTSAQRPIIDAAFKELQESQKRFFAKYADELGGANPERN